MEQSFQKGVVLHLASLIEYTEGGVISKQLIKSPAGNITLFYKNKKWLLITSNQSFVNLKSNTYEKNTVQRYHISGK